MRRLLIVGCLVCCLLMLAACGSGGVEWMPEYVPPVAASPPAASSEVVTSTALGKFVSSARIGPGKFYTRAEKGAFTTYTSLSVSPGSAVVYEVHTDKTTGLLLGKILRSLSRAVLVESILSLD